MEKKQRQALAISARLAQVVGGYAMEAIELEAARIVKKDAGKRANGGVSIHLVINGHISGIVKDAFTTVQFSDGNASVSLHDTGN